MPPPPQQQKNKKRNDHVKWGKKTYVVWRKIISDVQASHKKNFASSWKG